MNTITMQHVQKENRQKPRVSAGFVAGAEGLEPSARGFGVDVGERSQERGRGDVSRFPPQVTKQAVLVWCCGEISGVEQHQTGGKSAKLSTIGTRRAS